MVPSLGGGAVNLASLLGGGGLHTQMNPLADVLGGTTGLLGTSGVPNELAGLCALLGNQQSHNVSLTNLQVVELQRAMAAQKLATEQQAAAAVQAKIDEKVAEELKKVAPSNPPAQAVQAAQPVSVLWPSWRPMSEMATSEARAWGPSVAIEYGSKTYVACTYDIV